MKNRITKKVVTAAILSVLIVALLCTSAFAAGYSKTYGKTKDRLRVRASASSSATVIDNIVKDACVYISTSSTSGVSTFVKVTYRNSDGNIDTGWVCLHDGSETLVTILSDAQAQSQFGVKSGNLPTRKVGTFTASQRAAAQKTAASDMSSVSASGTYSKPYVTEVQNMLKDLGYYYGESTGNIGNKTEAAIEAFQKANNLSVDGVPGPNTYARLKSVYQNNGGSSSTASSGSGLRLGSSGTDVRNLQQNLTDLGYYWAEVTGNFGSKTEAAVKAFQSAKGLTADGVAGTKTLDAIKAAAKTSGSLTGETLRLEDTGETVRALQRDLAALGYYTGEVTGHFGDKTKAAVSKFQKAKGLSNDGVAGPATLNAIVTALGGNGSLSSSGATSASSLRPGDNNDSVRDMQTRLEKLGYYYGELTGNYGNLTEKAVRKFQDDNDLSVDGIAGTKTLQLLYQKTGGTYSNGTTSTGIQYGTLNTDNVSLRESYSKSAKSVVELDRGKALKITKTVTVNGETWYYCTAEKGNYTYKGYVRSDYVTVGSYNDFVAGGGDDIALGVEVLGMIRVTGDKVSIRADHKDSSDRLGYAYKGDVYYYINTRSYDDGWFQISSGGWISQKYATRLTESEMDSYGGLDDGKTSYRKGDKGSMVTWIQQALDTLDYYDGEITGSYGSKTHDAVQDFQRDHDLSGDGIAGPKTIAAIQDALSGKVGSTGSNVITGKVVYNLDWFVYKDYLTSNSHFGINTYKNTSYKAMLTDIQTGKTFDIKIQSTGNHIDAEPWDSRDTQVLASIYGKSSGSDLVGVYKRRPMIMTTKKGANVLVSIYPEPHGDDTVSNNDYNGQFCLHMVNSKTHGTDRVDDDVNGHQEMLKKGAALLTDKGYTVLTTYDGKGVQTGGTVTDSSIDIGLGSDATTVTPPPVTMHPSTPVYTLKGWTYFHIDTACESLKNTSAADMTSAKTTYGAMIANKDLKDKIRCPKCKPAMVYFGDTSKSNYHYAKDCPNLLSMKYEGLYESTATFIKTQTTRTHVCGHCNADGTTTEMTPVTPKEPTITMDPETRVYADTEWTYYHTDKDCESLKNNENLSSYAKMLKNVPAGKTACTKCNPVTVYYGKGTSTSYHNASNCSNLRSAGYDTIYSTTLEYATIKGRACTCSVCKK